MNLGEKDQWNKDKKRMILKTTRIVWGMGHCLHGQDNKRKRLSNGEKTKKCKVQGKFLTLLNLKCKPIIKLHTVLKVLTNKFAMQFIEGHSYIIQI